MAESRTAPTLFIEPGDRVDSHHRDVRRLATASRDDLRRRWGSERGREVLRRLFGAGFKRDVLESVVGRLYENYDLRGISLQGHDLSNCDLHNVDFFAANLRETKFIGCNLTNTHFSEADIRGADFSFARMNDAFLDNAVYDLRTTFTGVDIRHVNFNLAALLQDQVRTQQRIAHLKSRNPALAFVLHWTCNYGQSLGLWSLWVLGTILIFALPSLPRLRGRVRVGARLIQRIGQRRMQLLLAAAAGVAGLPLAETRVQWWAAGAHLVTVRHVRLPLLRQSGSVDYRNDSRRRDQEALYHMLAESSI
jgi:Pentapeptide repeats (9 copies)